MYIRARNKRVLKESGVKIVLGLDDIMSAPIYGSGYNEKHRRLGSNRSTDDRIKLKYLADNDCKDLQIET